MCDEFDSLEYASSFDLGSIHSFTQHEKWYTETLENHFNKMNYLWYDWKMCDIIDFHMFVYQLLIECINFIFYSRVLDTWWITIETGAMKKKYNFMKHLSVFVADVFFLFANPFCQSF